MKICSFNINSIRARPHQLEHLKNTIAPDVIGLQETKVQDSEFPLEMVEELGYHVEYWGQKGHYGVALLSKEKPQQVFKGFAQDTKEDQKRFIQATYNFGKEEITVLNGYFPQGENRSHESKFPKKVKYYKDLFEHISELMKKTKNIAVMGDFNVAPADIDVGIGEQNAKRWLRDGKCAFLPEEREMWHKIIELGFYDSWRQVYPEDSMTYSWFDYRSRMFDDDPKRGLRIDHILLSESLNQSLKSVGIDYDARAMEKPSDHCPIWAEII
jgi:exodeoxyribonuclease-3